MARLHSSIYEHGKKIYARIRIRMPDGKWKDVTRRAKNRTHAKALLEQLKAKYDEGGSAALKGDKMSFETLANAYKGKKVIRAIYRDERKVAGFKHPEKVEQRVDKLIEYWGARLIRDITYADVEAYKLHLIQTPTKFGRPRSIYDTNHYLRQLRIIFNFAKQNRWLRDNPFGFGEPLINEADEVPRDRAEREGEVEKLLAVCTDRRAHLRVIILLAIDTALRPAELLRLKVADIRLAEKLIEARATVTKTNRRRLVPISDRTVEALRDWCCRGCEDWIDLFQTPVDDPNPTLFNNIRSIHKAWTTACRLAKIENLQFKDLRHWATTSMVNTGLPDKQIMKITGHTQEKTFRRYITTEKEVVQDVGTALEEMRRAKEEARKAKLEQASEQQEPEKVTIH